jgi:hypothetical protein
MRVWLRRGYINVLRIALTATTVWYLFGAFRTLDRSPREQQ